MRGEHDGRPRRHVACARFIPACAGNTRGTGLRALAVAVHPRMRGEHFDLHVAQRREVGSSPHARGTPEHRGCERAQRRFIPACAGNTKVGGVRSPKSSGSSPHARGTRLQDQGDDRVGRFIPACAGNTSIGSAQPLGFSVHPRMRGEHRGIAGHHLAFRGSSPHARGTRPSIREARAFLSVHPRMRGEHISPSCPERDCGGSSPHARGTPKSARSMMASWRFIPACAGNTQLLDMIASARAVHPRMRGEHSNRASNDT